MSTPVMGAREHSSRLSWIEVLLHGGRVTMADVDNVREKLEFTGPFARDKYTRFSVLLLLSTVIATGGVIADSTAAVIGAMIVAPLMTPVMAMAFGVTTGNARNMARAPALILGGAAGVIGLAYFLAKVAPGIVDVQSNSQIVARTSPRVLDFVIALAPGAAGAFATGREDVRDALPGAAIAISLLPPLSVVGVCLAYGALSQAWGALLLFLTNVLAILVAGSVVFGLQGFGRVGFASGASRSRRRSAAVITISVLLLLVPLAGASTRLATAGLADQRLRAAATAWAQGTGSRVTAAQLLDGMIQVTIAGEGTPPAAGELLRITQARGVHAIGITEQLRSEQRTTVLAHP